MNIAVLIKQVPVSNKVSVDSDTHALIRASAEGMINPSDLNAIEAALSLRDQQGGKVVVFTMGPPQAEASLREAMAIGCDEACLITDRAFGRADTLATARVLAKAVEYYGNFNLIACGALSSDGATGQVGAMVAEALDIPHASEIRSILHMLADNHQIEVLKDLEQQTYTLLVDLPALVTFQFGCNEPRLATLRSTRAAKNKPMLTVTNAELKIPSELIGAEGSPSRVIDSWEPQDGRKAEMINGNEIELAQKLRALLAKGDEA
ncbi:MAG: electron transfer flavoprotein subunit beta/FixA family protein [Eubacteriales bacterium]|nr:electron transfer flavoprotein subunit beta/FixA family protein [Clostridiales bacterium]MDY5837007.1 electron transfer flavoprotein subunit beta/FixA family protein [Eubacteriales bacterium]